MSDDPAPPGDSIDDGLPAAPTLHDPDDPDRYATARAALSTIPLAVVVIGAGDAGARGCATGTAMYVSFAPPLLAIALHPGSRTTALVRSSGWFSVSVLREDQLDLAIRAGTGGGGADKFAHLGQAVALGPAATPALADAAAVLWCRVVDEAGSGDHRLFIGEVAAWDRSGLDTDPRPALVRHQRRYASIGPWASSEAPEGYPT
jgi:3-hydroxy-9,10-secoandrosta-1,3,5(10)-triene-9,17-dione monooxygenase reductase component